jgi:lipopolysaccharide heptosyltransferase II
MKRILIVKLWALGDILMATPLLRALKSRWPDCEITWLADKDYAAILAGNPLLHDVIPFDSGTWRRHWRYARLVPYLQMSLALWGDLKSRRFDAVLSLSGEKWWSVWFNAAPVRVGLFPNPRLGPVARLYTHAIPRRDDPQVHHSTHYLRAAEALGIAGPHDERLVLGVAPADRAAVRDFLCAQPAYDPQRPLVVLHPGTSQVTKCWPPAHFAAVANALAGRYNLVITGSRKERELAEAVSHGVSAGTVPPLVAVGRLPTIGQTAALVAAAAAVVTGDTSVLHIASALGTPVVGVYGSSRPGDNAPQFGPHVLLFDDTVPCAPCYKSRCRLVGGDHLRCQRAVTPAQVLNALETLRKESHEPRPAR